MTDPGLLIDLVAAVLVAFGGGALAQRLGLPVVVGYLLAGVAIGPFTPGFHANPHSIDVLAEIVVCGCGRVGGELVDVLGRRSIPFLAIEYHPDVARRLRERGVPVVYGDAANPAVLDHAAIPRARLLAALVPDVAEAERIVRGARALNPRVHIVARAQNGEDVERLRGAGADVVVQPEFEAGVEVIRHALQRHGVVGAELNHLIAGRRRAFYEPPPG